MQRAKTAFTNFKNTAKQNHYVALLVLLLISTTVRVFWMLLTDNSMDGDAPVRLFVGLEWARKPVFYPDIYWLPGHYYFTGGLILAFKELVWMPRIGHLILGVLTMVPFYLAIREEFDEQVAIYSGLVFALMPSHAELSSLTLSEPVFIFFLFTAFYCCIKFSQNIQIRYLVAAAIAIACMELLRYEGWIIAAALTAWLWFKMPKHGRVHLPLFLFLIAAVPVTIMLDSYINTDDFLASVTISNLEVAAQVKSERPLLITLLYCFGAFPLYLLPFLPSGIFVSIKNKVAKNWWLVFLLPCAYALSMVLNGSLSANSRYFITYGVLAIPLMVYGTLQTASHKSSRAALLLGLAVVYFCIAAFVNLNNEFARLDKGLKNAIAYTRQNLNGKRILIGQPVKMNMEKAFYVRTDAHLLATHDTTTPQILFFDTRSHLINDTLNKAAFDTAIAQNKIEYLVLCKNDLLRQNLGFANPSEELLTHSYQLVFKEEEYLIYRTSEL